MPVTPWMRYEQPNTGSHYLAPISYLPIKQFRAIPKFFRYMLALDLKRIAEEFPIKQFRAIPKFFRYTFEIQRQLRNAPGLIGHALEARPFSKKSWTLSVSRDQQSLRDFVCRMPHCCVRKEVAPRLGESQFAQWTLEAYEIPLEWKSAKAR